MTRNRNTASQLAAAVLAALLVGPLAVHSARAERPPPLEPGTVWAGEDSSHGQRGDATTTDPPMPVQAANPDHLDVVEVVAPAADADDSLAIRPGNTPPVAIAYVLDEDDNNLGTEVALDFTDHAGATVWLDGSASFDPDGDALSFQWSVASPSGWLFNAEEPTTAGVFDLGVHVVTLTVEDGQGGYDTADVVITVVDTTPPVVTVTTDVASLWPPNRQMVPVTIIATATDACTAPEDLIVYCWVTSSQPDDSDGTGEYAGDVNGYDGYSAPVPVTLTHVGNGEFETTIELRAEQDGDVSSGRVYEIFVEAFDLDFFNMEPNSGFASCTVVVPRNPAGGLGR